MLVPFAARKDLFGSNQRTCGSEPARESGGSVNYSSADTPPSRAGSLPQEMFVRAGIYGCSQLLSTAPQYSPDRVFITWITS
ncbi:hypothetical protein DMX03_11220 [Pseudomonas koreensis]|nr:hypothetical protein DMX03_11220 [Pseudomonas koreensis]